MLTVAEEIVVETSLAGVQHYYQLLLLLLLLVATAVGIASRGSATRRSGGGRFGPVLLVGQRCWWGWRWGLGAAGGGS